MFNADLALSVTMTAISTLMSVVMLPLNLVLYTKGSYDADVINNIDWVSLFIALGIVITAIGLGLCSSAWAHSPKFNIYANKVSLVPDFIQYFFTTDSFNSYSNIFFFLCT